MLKTDEFKGVRVLLLDGDCRQCANILKELHLLRCHITTLNYSKLDVGYSSRYPNSKLLYREAKDNKDKLEEVIFKEIKSGKYDVVFPLIELSSVIIARNYNEISKYVKITMPDPDAFWLAYNKQDTFNICQANKIPCPITREDGESLDDFVAKVGFPLALKPRVGIGSKGFHKAESMEELKSIIEKFEINVDEYIIQEFVSNSKYQYNTYIFIDNYGNVKTAAVGEISRTWPVDSGTPDFFRTVDRQDILDNAIKLLGKMNWHGYASVCFIMSEDDRIPKVMEINGRISASIRLTNYCGCNISLQHLQRAFNKEVYLFGVNHKENLKIKHTHTDILWFFKCKDRFKVRPSVFNIFKTKDMIFSWSDPLPFFTYGIQGILRYKKVMEQKKRK